MTDFINWALFPQTSQLMYMVEMICVLTSSMKNSVFQVRKVTVKAFNMHSQLDTKHQQIYLNKLLKCIWSNEEKI